MHTINPSGNWLSSPGRRIARLAPACATASAQMGWGILLLLVTSLLCRSAAASDDWEVLRVYIQDDQSYIDRLVTDDYFFEPIEELAQKLQEEKRRRAAIEFPSASLQSSIGIARIVGDRLVSDYMTWKLTGEKEPAASSISLGKLSMSVSRLRNLPEGALQLTDEDNYDPEGNLYVASSDEDRVFAFGFTALGNRSDQQLQWRLQLPAAPLAQLIVNLPNEHSLTSSRALVEPLTPDAANGVLEQIALSGWSGPSSAAEPGSRWWLVNHSGIGDFDLAVTNQPRSREAYPIVANQVTSNYTLTQSGGSVQIVAQLNPTKDGSPVFLDIPTRVRVNSIRFQGSAIPFQVVEPELARHTRLRVSIDPLPVRAELIVDAVFDDRGAATETKSRAGDDSRDGGLELPTIGMPGTYALQGQTNIAAAPGLILLDCYRSRELSDGTGETAEQNGGPSVSESLSFSARSSRQIQLQWSPSQPSLHVQLAETKPSLRLDTLTQLDIQEGWLSASLNGRLTGTRIDRNEVELKLGKGWFVDAVAVRGVASTPEQSDESTVSETIVPNFRQLSDQEGAGLRIWWEGIPSAIGVEIELLAHRPLASSRSKVTVRADRLLTAPTAQQDDYYLLNGSSSFLFEPDESLLHQQATVDTLPVWMNNYLPQVGTTWLLAGNQSIASGKRRTRGKIPSVTFERTDAAFVVDSLTTVDLGQRLCLGRFRIEALSGRLAEIDVVLPAGIDASSIQWSMISTGIGGNEGEISQNKATKRDDASTLVTLSLPTFVDELLVEARYRCESDAEECKFFVPDIQRATNHNARLLLPQNARIVEHDSDVDFPSPAASATVAELAKIFELDAETLPQQLVRINASSPSSFSVTKRDFELRSAYAHQMQATHRLYAQESGKGTIEWTVEVVADTSLEISLPQQCRVRRILVGDTVLTEVAANGGESDSVKIPLSAGPDQLIRLEYEYDATSRFGLHVFSLPEPKLSVDIAAQDRIVELPPGRMCLSEIIRPRIIGTLWDRLSPISLWQLVHPSWLDGNATEDGWRQFSDGLSGRAPDGSPVKLRVVTVDSALVACVFLAGLILLVGLLRLIGPRSHVGWCIACSIVAAATVVCPIWLLGLMQLLLLSVLVAYVFFMVIPILAYRLSRRKESSRTAGKGRAHPVVRGGPAAGLLIAVILGASADMALAAPQVPINAGQRTSSSDDSADTAKNRSDKTSPKVYGVLIPVDDELNVSGAYAYVPTELLRKLNGDSTNGQSDTEIRITAADYELRVKAPQLGQQNQEISLTADLVIQSPSPSAALPLAFDASELILERASIDGSEDTLANNIEQAVTTGTVTIRPMSSGRHTVQLEFAPVTVSARENTYAFTAAVPPIACATLRIVSENQTDFRVRSNGAPQRSMSSMFARIGALSQIDVTWAARSRTGTDFEQPTVAQSWVHVRGQNALCAVSVVLPRDIGKEIRLPIDPNWIPLGNDWGDATLLRTTSVGLGIQSIYTLRINDTPNGAQPVIRTLLAPRNPAATNSLRVPFLLPSGDSVVQRRLMWSAEQNPSWRLDGIAGWSEQRADFAPGIVAPDELPPPAFPSEIGNASDVADGAPATTPEFGGIATGSEFSWAMAIFDAIPLQTLESTTAASPQLRRIQDNRSAVVPFVVEETKVQFSEKGMQVRFVADVTFPPFATSTVCRVLCGTDLTVESIRVNDQPVDCMPVIQQGRQILTIEQPNASAIVRPDLADSFQLEIEFSAATRLGVATAMPRPYVDNTQVLDSTYTVLSNPSIQCEIVNDDVGFQPLVLSQDETVEQLKVGVASADLSSQDRDSVTLPTTIRTRRIAEVRTLETLMTLTQVDDVWRASLTAKWPSLSQPLPLVLIEVPSNIVDQIDWAGAAHRQLPAGDPSRTLVCVAIDSGENSVADGTRVPEIPTIQLNFPITTSRNATAFQLPEIKFLNMNRALDRLSVPSEIAGKAIEWTGVGKRVETASEVGQLVFERLRDSSRVGWRGTASPQETAKVLLEDIRLDVHTANEILGRMRVLVIPNGQFTLSARLSPDCELYGARVNGTPIRLSGSSTTDREYELPIRPNYLPALVDLFVRWKIDGASNTDSIAIPTFGASDVSTQRVVSVRPTSLGVSIAESGSVNGLSAISLGGWKNQMSVAWLRAIDAATGKLVGLSNDETNAWLKLFAPVSFGADKALVPLPSAARPLSSDNMSVSTDDAWAQLCQQLGVLPPDVGSLPQTYDTDASKHFVVSGYSASKPITFTVSNALEPSASARMQFVASGLLLLLGALGVVVTQRFGSTILGRLHDHTFLYWSYVTLLMYVVLPTVVPSLVFAGLTIVVLISELVSTWRRASRSPRPA